MTRVLPVDGAECFETCKRYEINNIYSIYVCIYLVYWRCNYFTLRFCLKSDKCSQRFIPRLHLCHFFLYYGDRICSLLGATWSLNNTQRSNYFAFYKVSTEGMLQEKVSVCLWEKIQEIRVKRNQRGRRNSWQWKHVRPCEKRDSDWMWTALKCLWIIGSMGIRGTTS